MESSFTQTILWLQRGAYSIEPEVLRWFVSTRGMMFSHQLERTDVKLLTTVEDIKLSMSISKVYLFIFNISSNTIMIIIRE